MTYKELVDSIQTITEDHYMIQDFGYGQVSDIKNSGDQTQADYPYAFMVPNAHTRGERSITYRFNLIMMEMVLDDDYLSTQSVCGEYLDDILAEIKYGLLQLDTNVNVSLTPFKERFQDEVAGMTAFLEIEIPQALNLCIAPFKPAPIPCLKELTVFSDSTNTFPYTLDPDTGSFWRWETNTLETPAIGAFNDQFFNNAVTGDFEFYITSNVTFIEPAAGESLPQPPVLKSLQASFPNTPITCDSGNWPTIWTADNSNIEYTAKYNITLDELTNFGIVQFIDQPANESAIVQNIGGTLTIGYEAPPAALVLDVNSTIDQLFRPDNGGGASPQKYQSITVDTYNGMRPDIFNYYSIQTPTSGSWVFTETGQAKKALGVDPFTNPRVLLVQGYSGAATVVEPIISTFPTDSPIDEVFNYTCTWEVELDPTQVNYVAFSDSNEPVTEPQYWTLAGVNLTGTYQPTI